MELYCYKSNQTLNYDIKNIERILIQENLLNKITITFDSPYKTGNLKNDKVYCELFSSLNKNKKRIDLKNIKNIDNIFSADNKLLIVVHGFGTSHLDNYYQFISKIVNNNISCAFINLPFHLSRTPQGEKSGERLIYYDDEQTLGFFHQSVVDIRKLVEIVFNNLHIKKISICGISIGSMVSVIAMAWEKKIKKGIFVVGGGNWEEIHWNGLLRFVLKGNCSGKSKIPRKNCSEFYSNFSNFLKKFKEISPDSITKDIQNYPEIKNLVVKKCFLCDPLAFAHKINPDNVLMINSKLDFYFSKKSTIQLWEELGKPRIYWLNYFHSSKVLLNGKVIEKIFKFLYP
jgi:hypothetical protein